MSVQLLTGFFLFFGFIDASSATARIKPKSLQEAYAIVQGPVQSTTLEARQAWNLVCVDWRQSIQNQHPEGSLLFINCGAPQCAAQGQGQACVSDAIYMYDYTLIPESAMSGRKTKNRQTSKN